jgi:putative nucleotidyltransferase with HDIG domain
MNLKHKLNHPIFEIVSEAARVCDTETYVIGGYVRDLLIERVSKDIDFVVLGNGISLAEEVAARIEGIHKISVFKNFGTAMIHYKDMQIEFVGARKESYHFESRKPVVQSGTLIDDQNRRDFTINALAISLNERDFGELIDPFNGVHDLEKKIIKTPLEPDMTFSDDPLRMMRAIRFASQLNFSVLPATLNAISRNSERINIISAERISEELNKILLTVKPSIGIKLLDKTDLLAIIFPQLKALQGIENIEGKAHKDNFYHTLEVLDRISKKTDNLWLRWAALLHDIAKPVTKKFVPEIGWTFHGHETKGSRMVAQIFRHLKLPLNEKMRYVQKLVNLHLRPIALAEEGVTDSAVRRLLFEAGDDIEDLMTLCEADITSKDQQKVKRYLENFKCVRIKLKEIEEKDNLRNWQPPVSGDEIMQALNLKPCKEVGIIKSAIREAILEGSLPNDHDAAFDFMINEGKRMGLMPQ